MALPTELQALENEVQAPSRAAKIRGVMASGRKAPPTSAGWMHAENALCAERDKTVQLQECMARLQEEQRAHSGTRRQMQAYSRLNVESETKMKEIVAIKSVHSPTLHHLICGVDRDARIKELKEEVVMHKRDPFIHLKLQEQIKQASKTITNIIKHTDPSNPQQEAALEEKEAEIRELQLHNALELDKACNLEVLMLVLGFSVG